MSGVNHKSVRYRSVQVIEYYRGRMQKKLLRANILKTEDKYYGRAALAISVAAVVSSILIGCGGGGGGGGSAGATTVSGVVYPVINGLAYQTKSSSGTIGATGAYSYQANESVAFDLGGIEIANVPAAEKITPLPLDSDTASTNLLRLLLALDTDHDLSNGVTLPTLTASDLTIDLSSETSVAAALASLASSATLPGASDAGVATALADAKTVAANNMGSYGVSYNAIIVSPLSGVTPATYQPKDAVVTLTAKPDWNAGSIAGTAMLTLNDNSQVTFTFSSTTGTYTAQGHAETFKFMPDYGAKSRIMHLYYGDVSPAAVKGRLTLRDNQQSNRPPVANTWGDTVAIGLSAGQPDTYTFNSVPSGPGDVMIGAKDFDGIIVSQSWSSSKGKTGTGNTFTESYLPGETGNVTLTVVDDEGATSSKTLQINKFSGAWTVTTTATNNNCGAAADAPYQISISKNGSALDISTPVGTYSGTISGNSFSWSGSYPEQGGTTTISLNATLSGNSFSGTSNWTWVSGATTCTGTDTFTGARN